MKSQRRGAFNQELHYMQGHGRLDPIEAGKTADAMADFLAKGGKVTRVKPVKGSDGPGFRNLNFNKRRGKK